MVQIKTKTLTNGGHASLYCLYMARSEEVMALRIFDRSSESKL
jgi:hypothetical protein